MIDFKLLVYLTAHKDEWKAIQTAFNVWINNCPGRHDPWRQLIGPTHKKFFAANRRSALNVYFEWQHGQHPWLMEEETNETTSVPDQT